MSDIYNIDKFDTKQMSFNLNNVKWDLRYIYKEGLNYDEIFNKILNYIKINEIHRNKVAVISCDIGSLKNFMYESNRLENEKYNFKYKMIEFERMIENIKEERVIKDFVNKKIKYNGKDKKDYFIYQEKLKKEIDMNLKRYRRARKFNFHMDRGMMKVSTIHSFKGWEIETVALIIEDGDSNNLEAIYTGITRSKNNLLIFNRGDKKLDEFFRVNIKESI